MKKFISLLAISCIASTLTGCTEERVYYENAYQNTQTPAAPVAYSNNTQQIQAAPSAGSTTYYTGVAANPPTNYNSSQTPPAPPSGYSPNQAPSGYYR